MPTFDFINIVNRIVRTALNAVANPFVIVSALAVALSGAVGAYVGFFSDLSLPTVELDSLPEVFSFVDPDWADFICYCLDLPTLVGVFNFSLQLLTTLLTTTLTFFVTCFSAYWIYKGYSVLRSSIKDVVA